MTSKNNITAGIVILILGYGTAYYAGVFGYRSYEDCVTSIVEAQGIQGARSIQRVCRDQFPLRKPVETKVYLDENGEEYDFSNAVNPFN